MLLRLQRVQLLLARISVHLPAVGAALKHGAAGAPTCLTNQSCRDRPLNVDSHVEAVSCTAASWHLGMREKREGASKAKGKTGGARSTADDKELLVARESDSS